ncbi:MAG: WecB/TagA/CpsF family glycosyltransferase [Ruminococcaceae bacterium]|nr:WecB/TagA/CpsF family glycosyltransferase [Oscillospiraceae bacterium]
MNSRVDILGVGFNNTSMDEALEYILSLMPEHKAKYIVTPNPEIVMRARSDHSLASAIENSSLVLPDGVGIMYGAKILSRSLKERIPGIDFTSLLFEHMARNGKSVFLFGAKPGIAEKAADNISSQFPGLIIVGTNDGYFSDDKPIIDKINEAKPDLLLVCLGFPKQELWMQSNADKLDVGIMIGAGGSLDVFSGTVERAPLGWRKLGLEWLHRLIKEPRRFKRMLVLPKFLVAVIISRIRG